MSEDCLSLNVWTSEGATDAPVFVWIHGGALVSGYSGSSFYDAQRLVAEGIVVVTINYRLGVLGWLAHPALSDESPWNVSGNYGLLDQIEALKWVKANIGGFGGDPTRVTIAGESAGALSVLNLLATPLARGLFEKAVVQSGCLINSPALKKRAHGMPSSEEIGLMLSSALGARDAAALRAIPANTLVETAAKLGYAPFPTIDGYVLEKQLIDTLDAGEQALVPVLVGFNSGEIRTLPMMALPEPTDAASYADEIHENYRDLADEFLSLYPPDNLSDSSFAAARDAIFGWAAVRLAKTQSDQDIASYLYYFDHGYPVADARGIRGFHAAEIQYVFGLVGSDIELPEAFPGAPDTPAERELSEAMVKYWTSFVKSGRPIADGQPEWPAFCEDAGYIRFAEGITPDNDPSLGGYGLHEEVTRRRRLAGDQPWTKNVGVAAGVIPPR